MTIKIIKGNAGTGKTHRIIQLIKSDPEDYIVVTPTNKAAGVLNKRFKKEGLFLRAKTIHSQFFKNIDTGKTKITQIPVYDQSTNSIKIDEDGLPIYQEKEEPILNYEFSADIIKEQGYPKVIIDEASMVSADIWYELFSNSIDIVAVGDDKQLLPIESEIFSLQLMLKQDLTLAERLEVKKHLNRILPYNYFFKNATADETLTVNYRQKDNGSKAILDIANTILKTNRIPFPFEDMEKGVICDDWDKKNINKTTINEVLPFLVATDIVIAFRNATCQLFNSLIRSSVFASEFKNLNETQKSLPRKDDKLYVDKKSSYLQENGNKELINKGSLLVISKVLRIDAETNIMYIDAFNSDTKKVYQNLPIGLSFVNGHPIQKKKVKIKDREVDIWVPNITVSYGYVITAHKAQGSEWNTVAVIDECHFHMTKNWRYTAVTRAANFLYCAKFQKVSRMIK